MKSLVILSIFVASLSASTFKDVEYLKQGSDSEKPAKIEGKLTFDSSAKSISFMGKRDTELQIPVANVTHVVYEKSSKPRYAAGLLLAWPLLFTKSKQHFLTIQYKDPGGNGRYAVFHLDKSNYREALADAEATTGQMIDRQEEK